MTFPVQSFTSPYFDSTAHAQPSIGNKIDTILKNTRLNGALTGISIREADTGEIIYSTSGDTRLRPASNLKLLTASSALEKLGPEYHFSTEVWLDGTIADNTLQGDLYLKGKGDPTLMKEDLDTFAKDLLTNGILKINGNIIADDSWYDEVRLSQDLNWSDESQYWGTEISALTLSPTRDFDTGTVLIEIKPNEEPGKPASFTLTPETDYVKIINHTKTVKKEEAKKITFEREHGTNNILIEGSIPVGAKKEKIWVAVWEPTLYTLNVFQKTLLENGIKLSKKTKLKTGKTPEDTTLLTYKKSMPLKDILVPFMKLSNNGHGEILTKELGKELYDEGSWDKGLQVIRETVESFGVKSGSLNLRDGSGISHQNMISANELSHLLFAVQKKSWYPVFENSLPVAGMKDRLVGGTLRSRLTEEPVKGNVQAKTGTIGGVSALSGYVKTKSGDTLIFSIIFNNFLDESVKSIEDEIVKTLAEM